MPGYIEAHANISTEIIDGELIIVDLIRGAYYNASGAGPLLWQLLEQGHDAEQSIDVLAAASGDADGFRDAARQWLETLVGNGILTPLDDPATGTPVTPPVGIDPGEGQLQPPTLEQHTDLEDILLFDPVHDVDALGWPNQEPPDRTP